MLALFYNSSKLTNPSDDDDDDRTKHSIWLGRGRQAENEWYLSIPDQTQPTDDGKRLIKGSRNTHMLILLCTWWRNPLLVLPSLAVFRIIFQSNLAQCVPRGHRIISRIAVGRVVRMNRSRGNKKKLGGLEIPFPFRFARARTHMQIIIVCF